MAKVDELRGLDELYHGVIQDHYRNPRNRGSLEAPDFSAEVSNPLCGDSVVVQARVSGDRVACVRTQGRGCALVIASASIMSEMVEGRHLDDVRALAGLFDGLMKFKQLTASEMNQLGPLDAFAQVRCFPIRIKCVLLAWMALDQGVMSLRGR